METEGEILPTKNLLQDDGLSSNQIKEVSAILATNVLFSVNNTYHSAALERLGRNFELNSADQDSINKLIQSVALLKTSTAANKQNVSDIIEQFKSLTSQYLEK